MGLKKRVLIVPDSSARQILLHVSRMKIFKKSEYIPQCYDKYRHMQSTDLFEEAHLLPNTEFFIKNLNWR